MTKGDRAARSRNLLGQIAALDGLDVGQSLWVLESKGTGDGGNSGLIEEADPSGGATRTVFQLGSSIPYDAVLVGDRLWVVTLDGKVLIPEAGRVTEIVGGGPPLNRIASDGTYIWTVAENGDVVQRSAQTGEVQRTIEKLAPGALAFGVSGLVWLAVPDKEVILLDGRSGQITRPNISGRLADVETCGDRIWVSQPEFGDGTFGIRAVSPKGAILDDRPTDIRPRFLECDGSRLWILSGEGHLTSLNT